MVTIAVDAMGGDNAPKAEVEGAVEAARTLGIRVILVGRQEILRRELQQYDDYRGLPIEVVNATQQVTMEDSAARAVRAKRDSSMRVASRLVRDGIAQGFVSAGNTGAVMATAKMVQGVMPGVDRPALAGIFPTLVGKPVVVIDVGANVDCSPRMLAQFAVMGEIYSRVVLHQPRPRVGLLSIGEEEHKGNDTTRGATPLLKSLPLDFVGNVEGRDIYTGKSDVIVCDGFIGNVALKVSEGLVDMVKQMLQESLKRHHHPADRIAAGAGGFHRFQEARGLLRIRRRAAAGRARHYHHLPRPVQRQRHQERHPRGGRILRRQRESAHRGRVSQWPDRRCRSLRSAAAGWPGRLLAQGPNNVKWSLALEPAAAAPGSKVLARLEGSIDPGWHVYSMTSAGAIPTTIKLAAECRRGEGPRVPGAAQEGLRSQLPARNRDLRRLRGFPARAAIEAGCAAPGASRDFRRSALPDLQRQGVHPAAAPARPARP